MGFEKNFLPKCYLDLLLNFADTMSEESVKNMISSVGAMQMNKIDGMNAAHLLYLHGIKVNEHISIKSARLFLKYYPSAKVNVFNGYAHTELSIYHLQEWLCVVKEFIEG